MIIPIDSHPHVLQVIEWENDLSIFSHLEGVVNGSAGCKG